MRVSLRLNRFVDLLWNLQYSFKAGWVVIIVDCLQAGPDPTANLVPRYKEIWSAQRTRPDTTSGTVFTAATMRHCHLQCCLAPDRNGDHVHYPQSHVCSLISAPPFPSLLALYIWNGNNCMRRAVTTKFSVTCIMSIYTSVLRLALPSVLSTPSTLCCHAHQYLSRVQPRASLRWQLCQCGPVRCDECSSIRILSHLQARPRRAEAVGTIAYLSSFTLKLTSCARQVAVIW